MSGLLARACALSGVSISPGPTALTRTPSLPSSARIHDAKGQHHRAKNCRGFKGAVPTGTDLRPNLSRAQAPAENECRLLPLAPQCCLTLEVRPRLKLIVRLTPLRRRTSV